MILRSRGVAHDYECILNVLEEFHFEDSCEVQDKDQDGECVLNVELHTATNQCSIDVTEQ